MDKRDIWALYERMGHVGPMLRRYAHAEALIDAETRLGRHGIDIDAGSVTFHVVGWPFKLPYIRRFDGYTISPERVLIRPGHEMRADLLAHELCHIYQMRRDGHAEFTRQYVRWLHEFGYQDNPYEVEARFASAP